MEFILINSQQIFKGSADTMVTVIVNKKANFILSFEGFLSSPDENILNFDAHEVIIHTGSRIQKIISDAEARKDDPLITPEHVIKTVEMTAGIKMKIVDWLFKSETLIPFDA
jgi:hypothetical protein